jgi:ATP synthase protein I
MRVRHRVLYLTGGISVNREDDDQDADELRRAVELRQQRSNRWQEEGERPLWKNLSMIGALGWLIVTPTLLGVLLGRWLDGMFASGVLFTGACIFLGVSIGGWFAWHRIHSE